MGSALRRRLLIPGLIVFGSFWIVMSNTSTGDWPVDAGPAVHTLAHGHLSTYLSIHLLMGPFATMVQAPFAALSGGGQLAEYQWASFPCVVAVGFLGLFLAGQARRRGAPMLMQAVFPAICLLNPLTFLALRTGHPEELLTAALAVWAIAVAAEGKRTRAAVFLGLALASKQWAVIAVLPVLMALAEGRLRVLLGSVSVAAVLILPGVLTAPSSFMNTQGVAASTGHVVTVFSAWYPFSGAATPAYVHKTSTVVSSIAHPLIVLLAFGLPLALALWRRRFHLDGPSAMALFALLMLLRCFLDPLDNLYYHLPLLLALLGWDALDGRGLPIRGLIGLSASLLFYRWVQGVGDLSLFNLAYLVVACGAAIVIALQFLGRGQVSGRSFDRKPAPAVPQL